jgi:hypothetical protein
MSHKVIGSVLVVTFLKGKEKQVKLILTTNSITHYIQKNNIVPGNQYKIVNDIFCAKS